MEVTTLNISIEIANEVIIPIFSIICASCHDTGGNHTNNFCQDGNLKTQHLFFHIFVAMT